MANDGQDTATIRASHDELLLRAVAVLRIRYEGGDGYQGLSTDAARELGDTLTGIAGSGHSDGDEDRAQAIALAHRLIDNDHPELSPLWPEAPTQG